MVMVGTVIRDAVKFGDLFYVEIANTHDNALQDFISQAESGGVITNERGIRYIQKQTFVLFSHAGDLEFKSGYAVVCVAENSNISDEQFEYELDIFRDYMRRAR